MNILKVNNGVKNMSLDQAIRQGLLSGGNTGDVTTINSVAEAYDAVSLVRRCITMIANDVAGIPIKITQNGELLPEDSAWSFENNAHELIKNTVRLYLAYGFALWDPIYDSRYLRRFDLLNSYACTPDTSATDADGNPILMFRQAMRGNQRIINPDEVIFFREFNMRDDLVPGKGMAYSALRDAQMMAHSTDFANKHFMVGPNGLVILEFSQGTSKDDMNLTKSFFKRIYNQGLRAIGRVLPLTDGSMKVNQIKGDMKDISQKELDSKSRRAIADAFDIPYSMVVDNAANFAVALEDKKRYYEGIVTQMCNMVANTMNTQVFRENKADDTGIRIEFAIKELPLFQADEEKRSTILQTMVIAGTPFELAWEQAGYSIEKLEQYRDSMETVEADTVPVAEEQSDLADRISRLEGVQESQGTANEAKSAKKQEMKMDSPRLEPCFAYIPLEFNDAITAVMRDVKTQVDLEGIEWVSPSQFHITIAYSPAIPAQVMRMIAKRVQFTHFDLVLSGFGLFDNGDEKALYASVNMDRQLSDLQRQVYEMIRDAGYELSAYSVPVMYTPHITLAYLPEAINIDGLELPYIDGRIPVEAVRFARDNYEPIANALGTELKASSVDADLMKELSSFENWYKKRVGKSIGRKFKADYIPRTMKASIEGAIDKDTTADEIVLIFHDVKSRNGGCGDEACTVCQH